MSAILKPTCFRSERKYREVQQVIDIESLLMELISPAVAYKELTDEQAFRFVEYFFESSIEALKDPDSNLEVQQDVLEWMFEAPIAMFPVKGKVLSIPTEKFRFSFRWCCKLYGFDPETMQAEVLASLRSDKRRGERYQAVYAKYQPMVITLEKENLWRNANT
ncbi:hypothetical protein [Gulbenkiania mobilis]|uniref:hypothetical protein n=1 Tax=Gulbenkiania mobilis TaxID=397457 RepID=UPI00128F97A5|nr:hypothetical protein [Gulbenkiania mobilis]